HPLHKNLGRNDQAAYAPVATRASSRSFETRSRTQKPLCKYLKRNGPSAAITLDAAYTPVSNRVSSRSF
ncbi:hypothetical protein, partial [Lacticaseibacillus paracasei]|uniref:hypothetical protein n=1 Tax=Lacticaseibacillus paracasei TaxID=1597 RepID=UPI000B12992F